MRENPTYTLGGRIIETKKNYYKVQSRRGENSVLVLTMESFSVVVYRARISPRLLAQGSKSDPMMEFSSPSRLFLELS